MTSRAAHLLARAAPAFLVAATAACASDKSLWLALPPLDNNQTLLVATPGANGLEVQVVDLSEGTPDLEITVATESLARGEIEALLYKETIDELGLVRGPLMAAETEIAVELPATDQLFRAAVDLDLATVSWAAVGAPSAALAAFRFEVPCSSFEPEEPQQIDGFAHFFVPVDADSVMVGTWRELFIVDENGVRTLGRTPVPFIETAHRLSGDGLVFSDGEDIYRAKISRAGIVAEEPPWMSFDAFHDYVLFDGDPSGAELYALASPTSTTSTTSQLWRTEGGPWSYVAEIQARPRDLVWSGPGEVLMLDGLYTLLTVKSGTVSKYTFPVDQQIMSLDRVDGNVFAGNSAGSLLRRVGADWRVIYADKREEWWVVSTIKYGREMMALLASGALAEIRRDGSRCALLDVFETINGGAILGLANRDLVAMGHPYAKNETWIVRIPRAPR